MLTSDEHRRYSRQLILPDFGEPAQHRLKKAAVLVVGAGGLGCPVLTYLAAAGVGRIGIVDNDVIEESNLHRQVLYNGSEVGQPKALVAAEKLKLQNPHVDIDAHECRLTSKNAVDIISGYDIVVDGSDNFPTRYLVNDACVLLDKILIYGAIHQYEGQVSVFNYLKDNGGRGPNYRDLFPQPPLPNQVPNCAEAGVLGILPGIIGCFQANETIKAILHNKEILTGKLLLFDAHTSATMKINISKLVTNPLNGDHPTIDKLIDYEEFCGLSTGIMEIPEAEFKAWLESEKLFTTIDVRELNEILAQPYNARHIPMSEFVHRMNEVPDDHPVVFVCRSGNRSSQAIQLLKDDGRVGVYYSLVGGINK